MPERMNWHIGRAMPYPYDGAPPAKQVAWVFDINKCIGCQTCSVACKTCWTSGKGQETTFWNNVESKPYGGYPTGWDLKLLDLLGPAAWNGNRLESPTPFDDLDELEPPKGFRQGPEDFNQPNLGEDEISGIIEKGAHFSGVHPMWVFYLARICNHCDHPACLAACPRKAIYKRQEDGVVLVDQERCRGYQECIQACPYKKVFFNVISRISEKCIACFPRLEQGLVALCVESCIGKIRLQGFLTTRGAPREDNPIDYVAKIRRLALPLYPQFGTGPNVYYIPPLHVPNGFLEQIFGPGVERAKELYRNLKNDRKLQGALLLSGTTDRIIERYRVEGDEVVAWDGKGGEVARVPFTEPSWVREAFDARFDAYRHNTT
ncbi:MAG: 4Fe-4S dicluster domain-containing protein [Alphaproteobacteria bacterium]